MKLNRTIRAQIDQILAATSPQHHHLIEESVASLVRGRRRMHRIEAELALDTGDLRDRNRVEDLWATLASLKRDEEQALSFIPRLSEVLELVA